MNTEKAKVKVRGITNLFHNRLECGVVEKSQEDKKVKGKGQKKIVPMKEALRVLFKNKKGKVYHPADHLEGCMGSAAADHVFKGNRTWKGLFKAGIKVSPVEIPLRHKWILDTRPEWVKSGFRSIPMNRHRPRFDKWGLEFEVEILDDRISLDQVKLMLIEGGLRYGIGDRRKKGAGKFEVISFKSNHEKQKVKKT